MKIIEIPAAEAGRLLPLLQDLHALHAQHQPERHIPAPGSDDLAAWLQDWLQEDNVFALAAESPQGALLGYLIYELQDRPALPVRPAETRAMLHHISVTEAWRRMGVGKALVEAMKTRALAAGATVVAATYAPFNSASAALMQGMGMSPVLTMAEWRA
ncbi:GNAT family N-acetyltransferase [Leisingera daeponensis]|uniref:GNAT family N-acetyltransferase n=1 Tax=Leisingera daeponensis TaxID=405746 RepID=A0ABS7NCG8_9RHOB|nr:GNAT family N-acetyltransferase [Leisingera daeponensis]MBY6055494.1 GNAT family N-acetyltransferase [Leisingera daeponensis]MBY6138888.1 GNAT family N-acetyltransferase [Leisingera daeponensis]